MIKTNDHDKLAELSDFVGLKSEDLAEIEERLKEAKEKASEFIRLYPLTSVGLGIGIGLIIGKYLSKK